MIPDQNKEIDAMLSHVEGNWFPGLTTISITPAPAASVASATMRFSTDPRSKTAFTSATVTINNAATWNFTVAAQNLGFKPNTYYWQFTTTDTNGVVQTYLKGEMLVEPKINV